MSSRRRLKVTATEWVDPNVVVVFFIRQIVDSGIRSELPLATFNLKIKAQIQLLCSSILSPSWHCSHINRQSRRLRRHSKSHYVRSVIESKIAELLWQSGQLIATEVIRIVINELIKFKIRPCKRCVHTQAAVVAPAHCCFESGSVGLACIGIKCAAWKCSELIGDQFVLKVDS